MVPRLRTHYDEKVAPALKERFGYKNVMQIPKIEKVLVSMCLKEAASDMKALEKGIQEVALITGQRPKITRAKKAIANFKLRKGVPLGCVSTVRGARMYEFLDRFVNVALPRVRDFRGVSEKGFDGRGNYSTGIKDQLIFPEIEYEKVDKPRGMNITIVTSANSNEEGHALLEQMGIPFRKKK